MTANPSFSRRKAATRLSPCFANINSSLLSGLGVDSFNEIVEQLRCDLNAVTPNGSQSRSKQESPSPPKAKNSQYRKIRYCNMSTDSVDFVRLLLTSMGFNIEDVPSDADNLSGPLVVNCTHASAKRLAAVHVPAEAHPWVIVADKELPADFNLWGEVIRLPASCAALRTACERAVLS